MRSKVAAAPKGPVVDEVLVWVFFIDPKVRNSKARSGCAVFVTGGSNSLSYCAILGGKHISLLRGTPSSAFHK